MSPGSTLTRREFVARLGAAGGLALCAPALALQDAPAPSRGLVGKVARAYSPRATTDFVPQQAVIDEMVASALRTLTGRSTLSEAVASLFPPVGPEDRIAVKVNAGGAVTRAGTRPETVRAVVKALLALPTTDGRTVRPEQVTVWDNAPLEHLAEALDGLCSMNDLYQPEAWDLDEGDPLKLTHPPDEAPLLAQRVLTQAQHFASLAAVKHHPFTLATGPMKNMFGSVTHAWDLHTRGPQTMTRKIGPWTLDAEAELVLKATAGGGEIVERITVPAGKYDSKQLAAAIAEGLHSFAAYPFNYYGQHVGLGVTEEAATEMTAEGGLADAIGIPAGRCFPMEISRSIPELWSCPQIGGKARFTVMDGILSIYDKGPYAEPQEFLSCPDRTPNLLLISTDPVANDQAGMDIVVKERALHDDLEPGEYDTAYLEVAERMGLGSASKIEYLEAKVD